MRYQINKNKFLNEIEQKQLLENLEGMDTDKYLPIVVTMKTGCRRSELLLLRVENVDFDNGTMLIVATKDSNDREIPLEPEVMEKIRTYIRRAGLKKNDLLFPISVATVFRRWNDVRPVDKKFHSLRHTFAINIFKVHKDMNLVKVALGHRNIQNTMVYVQYVYETEELRGLLVKAAAVA